MKVKLIDILRECEQRGIRFANDESEARRLIPIAINYLKKINSFLSEIIRLIKAGVIVVTDENRKDFLTQFNKVMYSHSLSNSDDYSIVRRSTSLIGGLENYIKLNNERIEFITKKSPDKYEWDRISGGEYLKFWNLLHNCEDQMYELPLPNPKDYFKQFTR